SAGSFGFGVSGAGTASVSSTLSSGFDTATSKLRRDHSSLDQQRRDARRTIFGRAALRHGVQHQLWRERLLIGCADAGEVRNLSRLGALVEALGITRSADPQ